MVSHDCLVSCFRNHKRPISKVSLIYWAIVFSSFCCFIMPFCIFVRIGCVQNSKWNCTLLYITTQMNLRKMVLLWTLKTKRNFQVRIRLLIVKFFVDRSSFGASFLTDTVDKRPQSKTMQLRGSKLPAIFFSV